MPAIPDFRMRSVGIRRLVIAVGPLAVLTGLACREPHRAPGTQKSVDVVAAADGRLAASILTSVDGGQNGRCVEPWSLTIGVGGGYGVNSPAYASLPEDAPIVYQEVRSRSNKGIPAPVALLVLPRLPPVAVSALDLCASEHRGDFLRITCLDDTGQLAHAELSLADFSHQHDIGPDCLELHDAVGARDLESVRNRWADAVRGCPGAPSKRRRVRAVLEVDRPLKSDGCYVLEGGQPTCAILRLHVPALAIVRPVGPIWNYPVCTARRRPHGLEFTCSDASISQASVYQVGRTLLYRVATQGSGSSHGGIAQSDIALESVELPCDVDLEFDLRSFERVSWERR